MVHRTMGLPHKSEPKNSYCVIWVYSTLSLAVSFTDTEAHMDQGSHSTIISSCYDISSHV